MSATSLITLFHAPNTRSTGTLALLHELAAPHTVHLLDMKGGEHRQPAYLAVNPLGKVPALHHHGELVTEQVACLLYLADLFPAAGLAPALDEPARGPYLRWMAYYAACFEPGMTDRAFKREPLTPMDSPYGDFDSMFGTLIERLAQGPHLLGERFSAADLLWGMALNWTLRFGIVPAHPLAVAYAAQIMARPNVIKVTAMDAQWDAEQSARREPATQK